MTVRVRVRVRVVPELQHGPRSDVSTKKWRAPLVALHASDSRASLRRQRSAAMPAPPYRRGSSATTLASAVRQSCTTNGLTASMCKM